MSKSSVTAQFTLYGCSRSRLSDRKQRNQLPNCTHKKIVKSHHVLKVARIQSIFSILVFGGFLTTSKMDCHFLCQKIGQRILIMKTNTGLCLFPILRFFSLLTRLKIRFLNFIDLYNHRIFSN